MRRSLEELNLLLNFARNITFFRELGEQSTEMLQRCILVLSYRTIKSGEVWFVGSPLPLGTFQSGWLWDFVLRDSKRIGRSQHKIAKSWRSLIIRIEGSKHSKGRNRFWRVGINKWFQKNSYHYSKGGLYICSNGETPL